MPRKKLINKNNLIGSIRKGVRLIQPVAQGITRKKHVMLVCNSETMEPHLIDYYEAVKDLEDLKFFLYYLPDCHKSKEEHAKAVSRITEGRKIRSLERWQVLFWFWNLIVCPDSKEPYSLTYKDAPRIYVNHGLHIVSFNGGDGLYAYDPYYITDPLKKLKFKAMFEPNRHHVEVLSKERPELRGVIRHVGYKYYEDIRNESSKKSEYRKKLGIKEDEILISVFGTWKADSLFHKVGKSLIGQAKQMDENKYRFVLSTHPREYTIYDPEITPVGPWVDSLAAEGFLIRDPKEDFMPYLIAADVVICDYSSFYELALIAEKPLILSDFPKNIVWKHSIARQIMEEMPVYKNGMNLEQLVKDAMSSSEYQALYRKYADYLMPPDNDYQGTVKAITKEVIG